MTKLLIILLVLKALVGTISSDSIADRDRTSVQLIESRGFKAETHKVITKDGYILAIHRIVNPYLKELKRDLKKAVLMQHGFMDSSAGWIMNDDGPHASKTEQVIDEVVDDVVDPYSNRTSTVGNNIGFELAMRGYDVWLSNLRGNVYSRGHLTLNSRDKAYWKWSFDQHIDYDVPAIIDYILNNTKRDSLACVAHSQGTLIMFGLLSTQPRFNQLVKPFIALAPVAAPVNIKTPLRFLAGPITMTIMKYRGGPFLADRSIMKLIAAVLPARIKSAALNFFFSITGFNEEQFNYNRLEAYKSHFPAGTSTQNVLHFMRNYRAKSFQRYDFGSNSENIRNYGSRVVPKYELGSITNEHIALFYSLNDYFSSNEAMYLLKSQLKVKLLDDYVVPQPKWSHYDFLLAKDAGYFINRKIIKLISNNA
jgi:pimeloyl-ACP methyl ester carboxylesterase